jgi:hypothetical protein
VLKNELDNIAEMTSLLLNSISLMIIRNGIECQFGGLA